MAPRIYLMFLFTLVSLCATNILAYEMGDCGGVFKELDGTFYSPDYPSRYPMKSECVYKFKTGYPVIFDCTSFKVEKPNKNGYCKNDWLIVIDNEMKTKYCGSSGPSVHMTGSASPILKFKSNASRQRTGFKCTYTSVVNLLTTSINLHSSGTCYTEEQMTCGCDVTYEDSKFYEAMVDDYRIVVANGIPNHVYNTGQDLPNPNDACPHEVYMAVPRYPTKGNTFNSYGMGPVGISVSGTFLYNHATADNGVAVVAEGESFDICNGHADSFCRYHYHEVPVCIVGEGDCTMVGYMRDGFVVYSFCTHEYENRYLKSCHQVNEGEDGSMETHYTFNATAYDEGDCDLDYANGYTFNDERGYAYVFTEDYPYIMMGYYGQELADVCYIEEMTGTMPPPPE